MPGVKYKYGTKDQLTKKAIVDGTLYVTTDTQELAVDLDGERIFPNKGVPDSAGVIQNGGPQPTDPQFALWLDYLS